MAFICLLCAWGMCGVGCDFSSDEEDFQVRVRNFSAEPVEVVIDGALRREVAPEDGASISLSDRQHAVRLQRADGTVLLEQNIDFDDGVFVRYDVGPDGSVTATGDSRDSEIELESSRRQVRVRNNFPDVIMVFIDDVIRADVPPGKGRTIRVSKGAHRVSLRRLEGEVLFEQTIRLIEGTYARYIVMEDGTVVAGGDAI
jgi:hypothetical protein